MEEEGKPAAQRYSLYKDRLWNQPRPRQFLERLERYGAWPSLLARVASLFVSGKHGEAEILAAIYGDLLRNRRRPNIQRRISDLRRILSQIEQDILFLKKELIGMKDLQTVGKTLGLPQKVLRALSTGKEGTAASLGFALRRLENLQLEAHDHEKQGWTVIIQLRGIEVLRCVLSRLDQNLLKLVDELRPLKDWESHRVAGYEDFYEFTEKELDLSRDGVSALILAREQTDRPEPAKLLGVVVQSGLFSWDLARKEEINASETS